VCVVIGERNVVLGQLSGEALKAGAGTAAEAMAPGPTTYRPNLFAEDALHYMHQNGLSHVLVTNSDGELIGVLRPEDAERALEGAPGMGREPSGNGPYRRD
jgi:CBS domain-containing protein